MTIVVVGDVMVDVVARHGSPLAQATDNAATVALHGGGGGGNVAAWLARAGADVSLAAVAGDDPLAEIAAPRARRHPMLTTGVCVVLVGPDGERTMLPDPGANLALRATDIPDGEVLYVSGYTLMRPQTRQTALDAIRRASRVVVDPASAPPSVFAGLSVDLVIRSAHEAHVDARETVVTRGAQGATWTDGTRTLSVPAAKATVVDTTGAGDAFAAGFISAWDAGPEAALAAGASLAGEAVATPGGRPARSGSVPDDVTA